MQYSFPKHRRTPVVYAAVADRRGLTLLELVMVVSILAILTALVVPGMTETQEGARKSVAQVSVQDLRDTIANRYMQDMADSFGFQGLPRPHCYGSLSTPTYPDTTRAPSSTETIQQLRYLPQLHYLFVNPRQYDASATPRYAAISDYDASTKLGWNGPYVMSKSSTYPDPALPRFPNDKNDTRTWSDFGFMTAYGQVGDFTVPDPWGSPIVVSIQQRTHGSAIMLTAYVVSAGPNKVLDMTTWTNNTDGSLNSGDDIALPLKSWKL